MSFKRKRPDSEDDADSCNSTNSSPSRPPFQSTAADAAAFPSHQYSSTPRQISSMMNSRTSKRFRNSRPDERQVRRHTLDILYHAQRSGALDIVNEPPKQASRIVTGAPQMPASHQHDQQSLHSFWALPRPSARPVATVTAFFEFDGEVSGDCDDCGASLYDSEDASMNYRSLATAGRRCGACGKSICFSCSVSNLGEDVRCLHCAGRL